MNASKAVTVSMLVTGTVVTIDAVSEGSFPTPQVFIALFAIWFVLGILADTIPQMAGPLAVIAALVVVLERGDKVIGAVVKKTKGV